MEEIVIREKCCGCQACMNICPKGAISMIEDKGGFKYPVIDNDKCIDCGLCKKSCPVFNSKSDSIKKIKAYACYNSNLSERLNSSSGGVFILIAKEILKRNGVVFGASFDDNFDVKHMCVETERDLKKFMGSKYVQSDIGCTYRKVRDYLNNGRYVLFTGTPCQIEGLKFFLKKDYDKLYTQDIICHGVPSPKVWRKYLKYQEQINHDKIENVSFRDKSISWSSFQMKIKFKNKIYNKNNTDDLYMISFLKNMCLRDSCYDCNFKKKYRNSDITLADYWGVNNIHSNFSDDKGTSLVIINSDKGEELFLSIRNSLFYEETLLDDALKYNSAMLKSVNVFKNKNKFFNELDDVSFDILVKKYKPKASFLFLIKKIIISFIRK